MKLYKLTVLILAIGLTNLSTAQGIEQQLQTVLDSTYKAHKASGIMVHIEAPNKGISWTSAVGFSDKNTKGKLKANQPVLVASNTKTYVSACVLKLVESHNLGLDNPIEYLLHKKTKRRLQKAGYNLNAIKLRHLLSHTSGITDYVTDDYFTFVNDNPQYNWTRDKQIKLAVKLAQPKPPGETFAYADINYLLLTEIIEQQTKMPFYKAIRHILEFKKHGLNSTWFVNLEAKPANTLPLAHQYEVTRQWDSYDINPSWDLYGGGGIATTTKDLAQFFNVLFNGEIIKDKTVLAELYTYSPQRDAKNNYCLGLYNFPSFFGNRAYYHGGWWGTDVIYLPEHNLTVSVFTLTRDERNLNAPMTNKMVELVISSALKVKK